MALHITVNKMDGTEAEHRPITPPHRGDPTYDAMEAVKLLYPNWSSMVVTVTREDVPQEEQ